MIELTEEQIERYSRQIVLREVGGIGQTKLLKARVLVVGAGGLGSPLALYLAAAGVGTIGIVDDDFVSLSNLQRQIIHTTARIGVPKTVSSQEMIASLNSDINVISHNTRLNAKNIMTLIDNYDFVADGSDNFETRFLVNDACMLSQKVLISAAILRFDGQISTFKS